MSERRDRSSQRIPLLGAPGFQRARAPSLPTREERRVGAVDLGSAFELASAELGFVAASWLFVEEVAAAGGDSAVRSLREDLGWSFPVFDFVASRFLAGDRRSALDTTSVCAALHGARRLLVVGVEAFHLDALAAALDSETRIGLVTYRLQRVDWDRVLGNFDGRIEAVDLSEFQSWAGARSALLTFVYGTRGDLATVAPAFMRVSGADVRTQFREIVGWDVLGGSPEIYPRYLVESFVSEMTAIVSSEPRPRGES